MGWFTDPKIRLASDLGSVNSNLSSDQRIIDLPNSAEWESGSSEVLCRASRWNFVSFRGKKGGEWRGIVDVLAIRKDTNKPLNEGLRRGDLFEIMIVQIKGGKARLPSSSDI